MQYVSICINMWYVDIWWYMWQLGTSKGLTILTYIDDIVSRSVESIPNDRHLHLQRASARNSGRIRLKFRDEFPQQADGPMPRDLCQDLESFDTARFSGFRLISDWFLPKVRWFLAQPQKLGSQRKSEEHPNLGQVSRLTKKDSPMPWHHAVHNSEVRQWIVQKNPKNASKTPKPQNQRFHTKRLGKSRVLYKSTESTSIHCACFQNF